MDKNMIYVTLEDYQNKCKAEAMIEIAKRYLEANAKYSSYNDLRMILGMEVNSND